VSRTIAPPAPDRTVSSHSPRLITLHADAFADTIGTRGTGVVIFSLLFLSSLPDAMVIPLLSELFVTRYGVSVAAAHWFMSINLLGALLALPLLRRLRTLTTPAAALALAAGANALFLGIMFLPIGFIATTGVRLLEGMADLIVFAILFDLAARTAPDRHQGRRLGFAGTVLMLGLFSGAIIGGLAGGTAPHRVFLIGAGAMVAVAVVAWGAASLIGGRTAPHRRSASGVTRAAAPRLRHLWPPLAMAFSDRAIAGLITATLPLYFAARAAHTPLERGWLIGMPILMMALLACPAGWLGDRLGHWRLRAAAACVYAGAIACIPLIADAGFLPALLAMTVVGLAGAVLLPSTLALTAASGQGTPAMGAYRAAGDVGYLIGIALAGTLLSIMSRSDQAQHSFTWVILAFAAGHVLVTIITLVFGTAVAGTRYSGRDAAHRPCPASPSPPGQESASRSRRTNAADMTDMADTGNVRMTRSADARW